MEKVGTASIWVGNAQSIHDVISYTDFIYDLESDDLPKSGFTSNFDIDWFDENFFFIEEIKNSNSLSETIVKFANGPKILNLLDKIEKAFVEYNANYIMVISDFDYHGKVKDAKNHALSIHFVGTVSIG